MSTKNSTYIILGLILLILSGIGGYFLFQVYQTNQSTTSYTSETTPKIELLPTDSPDEETSEITPASTSTSIVTPVASVSGKVTPTTKTTITPTKAPSLTPTKVPTKTPTVTPVPSSSIETFTSEKDGFSIDYSIKRKIYQDTESAGNRYTFYLSSGNFAVHVGLNGQWSWTHPDRQFDDNSLIAGQPSFRYDIAAQTIVDIQYNSKNYTIQCVHNGSSTLKTECEAFISSFKLL